MYVPITLIKSKLQIIVDNCQNGGCLKIGQSEETWFKAREHCMNMGGDLFYLKSNESLDSFLKSNAISCQLYDKAYSGYLHIGMRHKIWKWNGKYSFSFLMIITDIILQ